LEHISHVMTQEADADPKLRGYGTTLSLACGVGEHWLIAHVGDSRVYLFRAGGLIQVTHDHTVAQELADRGIIDQRQVHLHKLRNRLTRLLGDQVEGVSADLEQIKMRDGDTLLLCSDGLTEMVAGEQIAAILDMRQPATACCQRLIDAALAAGGKDNVTAVVARLGLRPPPAHS
jgi:protein phosphatase